MPDTTGNQGLPAHSHGKGHQIRPGQEKLREMWSLKFDVADTFTPWLSQREDREAEAVPAPDLAMKELNWTTSTALNCMKIFKILKKKKKNPPCKS